MKLYYQAFLTNICQRTNTEIKSALGFMLKNVAFENHQVEFESNIIVVNFIFEESDKMSHRTARKLIM